MMLLLPVAWWFVQHGEQGFAVVSQRPALYALIPLLGVISTAALICYLLASRMLAFGLFGLLGYVEPVLAGDRRPVAGGKASDRENG